MSKKMRLLIILLGKRSHYENFLGKKVNNFYYRYITLKKSYVPHLVNYFKIFMNYSKNVENFQIFKKKNPNQSKFEWIFAIFHQIYANLEKY